MISPISIKNKSCFLSGKFILLLLVLHILISFYDLSSPPISRSIFRQTQTAMITENFARDNFSFKGLYLNLQGNDKLMVAFEFPVYNFIVGLFFKVFGENPFWGKLVSFCASLVSLLIIISLINYYYGNRIALLSGLFYVLSPIGVVMNTSIQPDAIGVMFLLLSLYCLHLWKKDFCFKYFVLFTLSLIISGLSKYPLMVPYIPMIAYTVLVDKGRLRTPRLKEVIVFIVLFILPLFSWYLYRGTLTDPSYSGGELESFFIGNLTRFLHTGYYIKPFFAITAMILCCSGVVFFITGMSKLKVPELVLILGLPFFFIVIPTVAGQYYYLYPTLPIFALFMAKGFSTFLEFCKSIWMKVLAYSICVVYLTFFGIGIVYLLQHDTVTYDAAITLKKVSRPGDLVFSMNMHDSGNSIGGFFPAMFYLSNRKGWNVKSLDTIKDQIEEARSKGAQWLVITWFTPDLEKWFAPFVPASLRRKPAIDGLKIYEDLRKYYTVEEEHKNFAILKLQG
ncbi:MAG: ArnT family glycosyltransferase [Candidatus Xenobiia bacterium LiM19]